MYLCWLLLLVAGAGADTAATIRALDLGIATVLDTLPAQVLTYWPAIFHIILTYYLLQVQSARLAATEAAAKANRLSLSYGLGVAIGTALTIKVSRVTRVS